MKTIKINEQFLEVRFEIEKNDAGYTAKLDDYSMEEKEVIMFTSETKKTLKKQLKEWIASIIESGEYKTLKEKEYTIEIETKQLLKTFQTYDVAYHISSSDNQWSILLNGLIPNKVLDKSVYEPNQLLDAHKPAHIDPSFQKSESVYLHTEIDNCVLFEKEYAYKDSSLFAVDTTGLSGYVGSIGLSGFVLFDDREEEGSRAYNEKMKVEIEEELAALYWDNTLTIDEYKNNRKKRKHVDKEYGLDEILINQRIEPDRICLIGYWDHEGTFHFGEHFDYFVKENAKITKEEVRALYP